MKREVWKYQLSLDGELTQHKQIPAGARLVHCAVQNELPTLWFEVDAAADPEQRAFWLFATGHGPIAEGLVHRGSFVLDSGAFVLHVYEGGAAKHPHGRCGKPDCGGDW